jgi:predicted nucleic acid-binding protein
MKPVLFDSSFLVAATEQGVVPADTDNGVRLRYLLQELEQAESRIVVPTPVLAEVLVRKNPDRVRLIQTLQRSPRILLAEFGPAAAAVCSELIMRRWPKPADRAAHWSRHRLKFDMQIVAIAEVNNVGVVYTMDRQLAALCRDEKILALGFQDLPMPAPERQRKLDLSVPSDQASQSTTAAEASPAPPPK